MRRQAMRKTIFASAILLAATMAATASAQSVSVDRKQISNAAARKMVDACLAYAEKNNILVGVAVVGIDGVLLDFHAMQGGGPTLSETAILKAKTAVHWQRPTKSLEEDVTTLRNQASVWINDFPKSGALPILIDGQVAGAIGVGSAAKQEECAQAGIDAVLPKQPVASR
jgi:glc operon protein GlcG